MPTLNEAIDRINAALSRLHLDMEACECHGTLAGLLCAAGEMSESECVAQLNVSATPGDEPAQEARSMLEALCAETRRQLGDEEFGFQPLLPEDSSPIEERLGGLGEWCQGFVMGLSLGGVKEVDKLPGESGEAVRDLVEIASIDRYQLEGGEADEESYTELVEYVRTAVLLTAEELRADREGGTTLH